MDLHRTAVSLGLALVATACSPDADGTDPAPVSDDVVSEARFGLVLLTRDGDEPGVSVSGQLLATRGPSRAAALHALAQPEQVWLATADVEPGECRVMHTEHGSLAPGSVVDLLSVGELTVSAPDRRDAPLELPPRDFPPVSFALGGVVYDGDAPEALPYRPHGLYRVSAPGDQLGPIGGAVLAPEPIAIDEARAEDGALFISWGVGEARVIVARDGGSHTTGLLCRSGDGAMRVPAEAVERLGPGDAQITAARLRRAPLLVDGLTDAELLFVTRDTVDVSLPGADRENRVTEDSPR